MHPVKYLTKVRLPQRRQDVLRRARLVESLHESVDKRLILVVAAAGYGKTTLLVDFAHDSGLPVCWYSLDATDSDPRTFFEYLILALRQQFQEFGRQTERLLASVSDVTRDINSVVASLVNEIQTDINDYFILVLDDFHWMDDAEAINSAIDLLIYYLPDNCRLAISSRSLPRLTFSRLAAQRQVWGLGTNDLRFTPEEVTTLLRENYKLSLPAQQAKEVIQASEGWIAGIMLTTHTPRMGLVESIVKARGAGSPLFDYLANEAYLQQPEEVRQFLLRSSILDQINPDSCDLLFADGAARGMLDQITRANLFIEQMDSPGEWYRYHNLFQTFLRSKLKEDFPALHAELHTRAARLAEASQDWDRALRHFEEAGALGDAASLVARAGDEMMGAGRWQTLYRWLDSLPPTVIDGHPTLGQFRGRTYLWAGEHDSALPHLTRSAEAFLLAGDREGAGRSLMLKGTALRMKGRSADAIAASVEALALQYGPDNRVAAEARREVGICLASQGKLAEAAAELEEALRICAALADEAGTATISETLGIITVRLGDLARGMAHYRRSLATWRALGSASSIAGVLNSIGMVHLYTGEYAEALKILGQAMEKAREGGYLRVEAAVHGSLAHVRRDSGDLQGARESYEAALDLAHRVDDIQQISYLLDGLANTHRLLGDYATAERLLRQAMQQAEDAQILYEISSLEISLGILAEEQGDLVRAEKLLKSAVKQLAASGGRRDLARARFHLSRTCFAGGKKGPASRELSACVELCQQLGYDQFMVAEGQRAGEFMTWAVSEGIGGRRLERVARESQPAFRGAPQAQQSATCPHRAVQAPQDRGVLSGRGQGGCQFPSHLFQRVGGGENQGTVLLPPPSNQGPQKRPDPGRAVARAGHRKEQRPVPHHDVPVAPGHIPSGRVVQGRSLRSDPGQGLLVRRRGVFETAGRSSGRRSRQPRADQSL